VNVIAQGVTVIVGVSVTRGVLVGVNVLVGGTGVGVGVKQEAGSGSISMLLVVACGLAFTPEKTSTRPSGSVICACPNKVSTRLGPAVQVFEAMS
jgi:hypothetical protein